MLFLLALLIVPTFMAWQIVWTVRHGKLPPYTLLPGVTRRDMPVAFWLYGAGLSFATAVAIAFFVAALQARLHA